METDEILKAFQKLNLIEYPVEEVLSLFDEIGRIGVIQNTLHEGEVVYRARPISSDTEISHKSDLSYLPADLNREYKRASTPENTMFYGSVLPDGIIPGQIDDVRVVGAFECVSFLRDTSFDGEQIIAFGKWRVTNDIPLMAIVHKVDFADKSAYVKEMREGFEIFINEFPDLKEKTIKVLNYLASEFSKGKISGDYDYLISSLFTENLVQKGLAGVFYPSVRTEGDGYNVAIHPSFVDLYMELKSVGVCTVYKSGKNSIVDNETVAFLKEGDNDFLLKSVEKQYHMGREEALRRLNE